jgi:radical SAM superfamily enzyme YgiQ (UPF0313 family)
MNNHVDVVIFEAAWSYITQTTTDVHLNEKHGGISFNGDRTSYPSRFLGPSKIAQRIREGGYTCQVISFVHFLNQDQLVSIINKFVGPRTIIGISSTFANGRGCKAIAHFMRNIIGPKITNTNKTIIGGPSAHIWSKIIEKNGYQFDHVVVSFAENKIIQIINNIKNTGLFRKVTAPWDIQTCQHRWHSTSLIKRNESLPLECARGCIFECKFCRFTMLGKKKGTYVRDINLIKDEMLYNYDHFGTTNYMLTDDTFNDTPEKVEAWADMVSSLPFKIQYVTYLRVDLIHRFPHTAKLLQDSGLLATHFGIESLTPKASTLIGKAWSGKHAREYVPELTKNVWGDKINVFISLIAGLPHETPDDWQRAGEWAVENNLSAYYATLGIEKFRNNYKGIWNEDEREGISYFDIHAEEYGYQFVTHKGRSMWILDGMTEHDVARRVAPLNDYFDKHCRVTAWGTMEMLSLGIDQNYILNNPRNVVYGNTTFNTLRDDFVTNYFHGLMEL